MIDNFSVCVAQSSVGGIGGKSRQKKNFHTLLVKEKKTKTKMVSPVLAKMLQKNGQPKRCSNTPAPASGLRAYFEAFIGHCRPP